MDDPSKRLHKFKNKELERKVFTHTSAAISANRWAPDLKAPHMDNQRLEFIGDAILKGSEADGGQQDSILTARTRPDGTFD